MWNSCIFAYHHEVVVDKGKYKVLQHERTLIIDVQSMILPVVHALGHILE
eukprot:COSAG01_NODE_5156_length_4446_cov_2.944790_2_plen_50_part_00